MLEKDVSRTHSECSVTETVEVCRRLGHENSVNLPLVSANLDGKVGVGLEVRGSKSATWSVK